MNIQDTHTYVQYSYIFSSVIQQKEEVETFIKRNKIRSAILESSAYQSYWARALLLLLEVGGRVVGNKSLFMHIPDPILCEIKIKG